MASSASPNSRSSVSSWRPPASMRVSSWLRFHAALTGPARASRYARAVAGKARWGLCGSEARTVPGAYVRLPRSSTWSGGRPVSATSCRVSRSVDFPLPFRPTSATLRLVGIAKLAPSRSSLPAIESRRAAALVAAAGGGVEAFCPDAMSFHVSGRYGAQADAAGRCAGSSYLIGQGEHTRVPGGGHPPADVLVGRD